MKKAKFAEQQTVFTLKKAETSVRVEEVCREMVISEATFHNWKMNMVGWK